MLFSPSSENKVDIALAIKIIDEGVYLGRSRYMKDTCWACYEYQGNFYITLQWEITSMWEADEEDIEIYNEVPASP